VAAAPPAAGRPRAVWRRPCCCWLYDDALSRCKLLPPAALPAVLTPPQPAACRLCARVTRLWWSRWRLCWSGGADSSLRSVRAVLAASLPAFLKPVPSFCATQSSRCSSKCSATGGDAPAGDALAFAGWGHVVLVVDWRDSGCRRRIVTPSCLCSALSAFACADTLGHQAPASLPTHARRPRASSQWCSPPATPPGTWTQRRTEATRCPRTQ